MGHLKPSSSLPRRAISGGGVGGGPGQSLPEEAETSSPFYQEAVRRLGWFMVMRFRNGPRLAKEKKVGGRQGRQDL